MRRVRGRTRRRDAGAIALIVTILFAAGVFAGCAALTVDVGQMMSEKRQLQNGADASALSLAQTCGLSMTNCTVAGGQLGGAAAGTTQLNNVNAQDGVSAFDPSVYANGICGRNTPNLPPCGTTSGRITDCAPLPSYLSSNTAIPYVEVHTLTKMTSGSTILPSTFAGALTGSPGGPIASCSRVSWGAIGSVTAVLPVTFSLCEYQTYRGTPPVDFYPSPSGAYPGYGGASQPAWPSPATTPATPGQEIVIYLQDHGSATNCHTFNGHDVPGGFGYLETSSTSCGVSVSTNGWVQVDTGNSTPCDVGALVGHVILIPVFDCTVRSTSMPGYQPTTATPCAEGTGNNTWYHIYNFASFYVSGYKTGGSQQQASLIPPNAMPCSGGDRCISGWFVRDVEGGGTPSGPPDGSGNLGTFTVAVAG